jgi:hypothetical protein
MAVDQVLAVTQADAARAYRDLSVYAIRLVLKTDGWHVRYDLTNERLKGGGPRYLIDAVTGAILSRTYEQ